jgi:hypothetical protein
MCARALLAFFVAAFAVAAQADGNVVAVLPTQGTGGTRAEAELTSSMMRLALQKQAVAQVPAAAVQASATFNGTACQQSAVACARLVGRATGATRVVASELWDDGGTLELRLALVDLGAGGAAGTWRTFTAADKVALGRIAQQAVLALVVPEASVGRLTIALTPGAEILVDGVARERTPMLAPLELAVGRHEIEVRLDGRVPWRGFVEIAMDASMVLRLCERAGALTDVCADAPTASPATTAAATATTGAAPRALRAPLSVGGFVGLGVGALGVVVGSVAAGAANASFEEYGAGRVTATQRDDALGAQGVAAGSFVVGAVALVAGTAALTASLFVE